MASLASSTVLSEQQLALADGGIGKVALGHVAEVADDAADGRLLGHVGERELVPGPASVGPAQAPFAGDRTAAGDGKGDVLEVGGEIVRVDEVEPVGADELVGPVAGDAFHGRRHVQDRAVAVEDHGDVGGVKD